MAAAPPTAEYTKLLRVLTVVVLAAMLVGVLYAAWISLINFSRIGV